MAYIPPHKRQTKAAGAGSSSTPPPESAIPPFQRNPNPRPRDHPKRIVCADHAISKWFVVGLTDESRVADLTRLEPLAVESFERRSGEKPLVLVLKEKGEEGSGFSENPWSFVAETVKQDLLSSFQRVKQVMGSYEFREIKPTLVVRFGTILFHGNRSSAVESIQGSSLPGGTLKQLHKSLYTDIPQEYVDYITNNVVQKIDFEFKEKEQYRVRLSDNKQPNSTISCKCTVGKDSNQLELYKVELNPARHIITDMSCLDKNLDVRLMLILTRILVSLTDEELENIKSLISSAILDPEVKGGLRWPLGKQSSGNRYTVISAWHTNAKIFENSSMRLKVRHADRFDFKSSQGEAANEVSLSMPGVTSLLREEMVDSDLAFEIVKENLKLIWNHFLT